MDLTWVAAGSLLLVGTGYAFVRQAHRFRIVWWGLICASLFALATRDLFRPRERGSPASGTHERMPESTRNRTPDRPSDRPADAGSTPRPLVARLRRRFASWLD